MVAGAVRTDLILSAEIMVIALDEVADESFWARLAILVVVAFVITIAVYGVVALIVKMDDAGLLLTQRTSTFAKRLGHGMVSAMPRLLAVISVVGTVAMLWVGGHILLVNLHEVGWWEAPYELVHDLEDEIQEAAGVLGGVLAWRASTRSSRRSSASWSGGRGRGVVHLLPIGRGRPTRRARRVPGTCKVGGGHQSCAGDPDEAQMRRRDSLRKSSRKNLSWTTRLLT